MTLTAKTRRNTLGADVPSPERLYCIGMEEVKFRLGQAQAVLKGKITFDRSDVKEEFLFIQLRKILELIAFSSLIANKAKYAEVYEDFHKHWNAKRILKKVEEVNPDFYPNPSQLEKNGENSYHVIRTSSTQDGDNTPLTKNEFIGLYNLCGEILHIPNPFKQNSSNANYAYSSDTWIKKICLLLDTHVIGLVDNGGFWIVRMSEDGRAKAYVLSPALGGEYIDFASSRLRGKTEDVQKRK
ncbi:MAG TPA: hypothetical protein VIG74_00780 [Alphaproteobacteria bacterium]